MAKAKAKAKTTAKPAKRKPKQAPARPAKPKARSKPPKPTKKKATKAEPPPATWVATGREWGPESQLTRAIELHRQGKLAAARTAYERAIAEEDGGTGARLQLLEVLDALDDNAAVLALVDELTGRGKTGRVTVVQSPVIHACEARARLRLEDFTGAEAAARAGVAHDENDVEAWRLLAVALAAQGNTVAALEPAERVTSLVPKWAPGHFTRAIYLHRAGRTAEAAVAVERSTQLEPNDGDAWFNVACYRALLGDKREALAALTEAIRIDKENAASARTDGDLVSLANDARFKKLTA